MLTDMTFTFSHDHVGITVTPADLDATIAWYSHNLGFTVGQRFESHGTTFVYLTAGDVKIELLAGASAPSSSSPRAAPRHFTGRTIASHSSAGTRC